MPIFSLMATNNLYVNIFKPLFDRLAALVLFMMLLPFLLVIAIVLAIHFGGSPIFKQQRVGKEQKKFVFWKFRSMRVEGDEESMTVIGKFIRSISLDELPQLVNIIIGHMSLVGPRPLLVEYIPYYDEEENLRHMVKPGITGWAQINGRNEIGWEERMNLDVFYVRNISMMLDLKILFMTVGKLFQRDSTPYKKEKTIKFSEYKSGK